MIRYLTYPNCWVYLIVFICLECQSKVRMSGCRCFKRIRWGMHCRVFHTHGKTRQMLESEHLFNKELSVSSFGRPLSSTMLSSPRATWIAIDLDLTQCCNDGWMFLTHWLLIHSNMGGFNHPFQAYTDFNPNMLKRKGRMCSGIYLVPNSYPLSIIWGALSRLDCLSRRSCHSISFRLLE